MSATPDSTLADLQRQLAEYKAERDEALAREIATAEVLQVINASPGDLAPVFDAIIERAMRLCEAAFGTVSVGDSEQFAIVAQRGVPEKLAEYFSRIRRADALSL